MKEKELTLLEIQEISVALDDVKNPEKNDPKNLKDIDGKAIYWMGRLRDFVTPILDSIQNKNNESIKKYTIKENADGTRKINTEKYSDEQKKFLEETKEKLKFPDFKASQFMKGEQSLVPPTFWQFMSKYIEIDVEWMKE